MVWETFPNEDHTEEDARTVYLSPTLAAILFHTQKKVLPLWGPQMPNTKIEYKKLRSKEPRDPSSNAYFGDVSHDVCASR